MSLLGAPDSSELSSLIYLFNVCSEVKINVVRIKIRLFNFTVFSNHLAIFNFVRFNDFFLDPVSYSTWKQQEKKDK